MPKWGLLPKGTGQEVFSVGAASHTPADGNTAAHVECQMAFRPPATSFAASVFQFGGRTHSNRQYWVTVTAEWPIDGTMHIEPAETYKYDYPSDKKSTAPLEREAKRAYRIDHPGIPAGGPQMRMRVTGRVVNVG